MDNADDVATIDGVVSNIIDDDVDNIDGNNDVDNIDDIDDTNNIVMNET